MKREIYEIYDENNKIKGYHVYDKDNNRLTTGLVTYEKANMILNQITIKKIDDENGNKLGYKVCCEGRKKPKNIYRLKKEAVAAAEVLSLAKDI